MRRVDNVWTLVDRRGDDECWEWKGNRTRAGYGTFRGTTAHRFIFQSIHGPVADGLVVMHDCDNRACCNPTHLRTGTQKENIADMHRKGRAGDCRVFGERHGRAKLTTEQVRAVLAAFKAGGKSQRQIGALVGVTQSHVSNIVLQRCRQHG